MNPLSLFSQSPFKSMQLHMQKASQGAEHLVSFFDEIIKENWDEAKKAQLQIASFENEADKLKQKIRVHLPNSVFLPVSRADLLNLLSVQDKVANTAKDIAGLVIGRKMQIPKEIRPDFIEFVAECAKACTQAYSALKEFDNLLEAGFRGREVKVVHNIIKEIDKTERKTDEQQIEIRSKLFAVEKELSPIDVMFLYQIIELLGEIANRAERVGNRLELLIAK